MTPTVSRCESLLQQICAGSPHQQTAVNGEDHHGRLAVWPLLLCLIEFGYGQQLRDPFRSCLARIGSCPKSSGRKRSRVGRCRGSTEFASSMQPTRYSAMLKKPRCVCNDSTLDDSMS